MIQEIKNYPQFASEEYFLSVWIFLMEKIHMGLIFMHRL